LALEAALLLDVVADRLSSMKASTQAAAPTAEDGEPDVHGGPAAAATPGTTTGGTANSGNGAAGSATAADGRCPECGSVPGASCTACPLCRFMALLRGERPEATARLVDGALMIIRTLRSLVPDPPDPAAAQPTGAGAQQQGQQHSGQSAPAQHPGRHGGLEHIDIL
jgi:hypothetical protein